MSLYNWPEYYDIAFSRDLTSDLNFFISCFKKYGPVKKVLEPACGTGVWLIELAKRGYYVVGYDINHHMVKYAKRRIIEEGLEAEVLLGDMRYMKFKEKFDAAIIPINSLGYCLSDDDILNHFQSMAFSLNGIYIVEISCACEDIRKEKKPDEFWISKRGNIIVECLWRPYSYDFNKRLKYIEFKMKVKEGEKCLLYFEEEHKLRLWIYEEFKDLVERGGFQIAEIYDQNYNPVSKEEKITGELGSLYYILTKKGY
ncbi:Ubiquinone/menaquinone biosynthesis C-methyltransferase UbiE [archaeon HR06]|nr:Ubiquinone/menaquinone biosynthesis C-methyltransferase UbiE [archaeon HR06]